MKLTFNTTQYPPAAFCFLVALCLSLFLGFLDIDAYKDRSNYLEYASSSHLILARNVIEGPLTVLFNEPLWLIINMILSLVLTSEWVLRTIIITSSFLTVYTVLRNVKLQYFLLAILFLLLPTVMKNNIIHIRQGLAIAVFLIGWFSSQKKYKYLFIICSAFIHSSFIIVIFGLLCVRAMLHLKLSYGIRNFLYVLIALFLGVFGLILASTIGARQGGAYKEVSVDVSGLGFLYWSAVTVLFVMQERLFLHRHAYSVFYLFLYLGTYFLLPVTARIFESVLIIILLSSLEFKNYKLLFLGAFFFYFVMLWASRIGQPGFGWAG